MGKGPAWSGQKHGRYEEKERTYIALAVTQDVRVVDMAKHLNRNVGSVASYVHKYCKGANTRGYDKGPTRLPKDEPGVSNDGYGDRVKYEIEEAAKLWTRLLQHERYDRGERLVNWNDSHVGFIPITVTGFTETGVETLDRDRYYNMGKKTTGNAVRWGKK